MEKNEIKFYKIGKNQIRVQLTKDTIWLSRQQIAGLFNIDRSVVSRHIKNIYESKELSEKSTCAKNAHVGEKRKNRTYKSEIYNLDIIISVGYRVNSKKATQFRIWATKTLRNYLVDGFAIDKKRLANQEQKLLDIQKTIQFIRDKSDFMELKGHEKELLDIISEYSKSLILLDRFDSENLQIGKVNRYLKYQLEYDKYSLLLNKIKSSLRKKRKLSELFGNEIGDKMKGIIGAINQTFDGVDLYQSIEEKAANLLYLIIKDHPFSDGNKRISSILFIYFLNQNRYLFRATGEKKINDNAIVALALLVATSNPNEKDNIIKLIINLIKE